LSFVLKKEQNNGKKSSLLMEIDPKTTVLKPIFKKNITFVQKDAKIV